MIRHGNLRKMRFGGKNLVLRKSLWIMAGAAPVVALAAANPAPHQTHETTARPTRVHLTGDVFVERFEPAQGGRTARVLERADELHSGDRLVFVVGWSGGDPAGFTVINPVPPSVAFQAGTGYPAEEVSVDGGHSWGSLTALTVHDSGGWRNALPGDVTHVRWRVPGGAGQITYRGVVR